MSTNPVTSFSVGCFSSSTTLRPNKHGWHFADNIFKCCLLERKVCLHFIQFDWTLFASVQLTISVKPLLNVLMIHKKVNILTYWTKGVSPLSVTWTIGIRLSVWAKLCQHISWNNICTLPTFVRYKAYHDFNWLDHLWFGCLLTCLMPFRSVFV